MAYEVSAGVEGLFMEGHPPIYNILGIKYLWYSRGKGGGTLYMAATHPHSVHPQRYFGITLYGGSCAFSLHAKRSKTRLCCEHNNCWNCCNKLSELTGKIFP